MLTVFYILGFVNPHPVKLLVYEPLFRISEHQLL